MSLGDQISGQEGMAQEIQQRLDGLGTEFAKLMRGLGAVAIPILDTTGKSWQVSNPEPVSFDSIMSVEARGVEPRGDKGWGITIYPRHPLIFGLGLAVTEAGKFLLTERATRTYGSDKELHFVSGRTIGQIASYTEDGLGLIYVNAESHRNAGGSRTTWRAGREQLQSNLLTDMAEQAQVHGLDAVMVPIEQAMLHEYNLLRKKPL